MPKTRAFPTRLSALPLAAALALAVTATPAHAATCPNEAIREQQNSRYLPDCRAYELVNPPDKNSSNITGGAIDDAGDRVVLEAAGGADGGGLLSPTLSTRNADDTWVSHSMLPPSEQRPFPNYILGAYTPSFTRFIAEVSSSTLGGQTPAAVVALDAAGHQRILSTYSANIKPSVTYMLAADDLSHVYASVNIPIDPGHVPGTNNIYDVTQNPPMLASRLPDGTVPACGAFGFSTDVVQRTVSSDGTRIFFRSLGNGPCDGFVDTLYMRDTVAGTTTAISAPPVSGAQHSATFLQANPQGTAAIFATNTALTADDTDTTGDIYRWDETTGLTCLTCIAATDANVTSSNGNDDFSSSAAVSPDLSHVYFTSNNALTPADIDGGPSLYVWHVTATSGPAGQIDYISPDDHGLANNLSLIDGVQVTPDGNALLFKASSPGLDAITHSQNGGTQQLYHYDDRTKAISCISCSPHAPATQDTPAYSAPFIGSATYTRVMSDDGTRVVFYSLDPLVPQDTNNGSDIYEWHETPTGGEVGLISNGTTVTPPTSADKILGMSRDGTDILFLSDSPLTPGLTHDTGNEAYDARIGGGALAPVAPPPPCSADACQGPPSGPPAFAAAGSALFSGAGNLAAPTGPAVAGAAPSQTKTLTRAQKLARALRTCHAKRPRAKRSACERQARARYGAQARVNKRGR